jgi:hypothetical protein
VATPSFLQFFFILQFFVTVAAPSGACGDHLCYHKKATGFFSPVGVVSRDMTKKKKPATPHRTHHLRCIITPLVLIERRRLQRQRVVYVLRVYCVLFEWWRSDISTVV